MQLAGDNPRINAVKLSLGSVEFPMVQWTVEEAWNLFYFSEGFRLTEESSWMRIEEKTDDASNTIQINLPLYLNPIQQIKKMGAGYYAVKTRYTHGLWMEAKRCVLPCIAWGDVEIVCSSLGRVNLTRLHETHDLEYLSENEFMVKITSDSEVRDDCFGYVYLPTIPSPHALCDLVTVKLLYSTTLASYCVKYDSAKNHAALVCTAYPEDCVYLNICLFGSQLVKLLGYNSEEHVQRFYKKTVQNVPAGQVNFVFPNTTDPPLVLPSETFPAWTCVNLTPGWYSPAHRPMCTGAPLKLTAEIENAFNRLFFPIPERIPKGHATSHFIVFSDPAGMQHLCPIYAGKYDPGSLCAYLEDEMSRLSRASFANTYFAVDYDHVAKQFTFSCEVRDNGCIVPATFSLFFNHPASVDGSRFGFANHCLRGSDTYTSNEVCIPYMKWTKRGHFNTYKVSEIGHQKRFVIESAPISQMLGLIKSYDTATSELVLMTYVGQLPYVHGLQTNDVVSIVPTHNAELYQYSDEHKWSLSEHDACPLAPNLGKSGVVKEFDSVKVASSKHIYLQTLVKIQIKPTHSLASCVGQVVSLVPEIEPFNMCFGHLPRSIPPRILGFGKGAVQWGRDGHVASGTLKIPPFIAKAVHNLDHPDYVLLYIEEGKKGTALQHSFQNNTTTPFAKLVLYPMFREERMLPRDTTLLGSEMLSTFTLAFRNPDGTPYHFHGIDFSFSFNFVRISE